MDYNVARKITVKGIVGTIKRPEEGDKPRELMTVIGIATGIRQVEDRYHPGQLQYGIKGTFEAVNTETGEVTTANEVFLPSMIQDAVVEALKSGKNENVQFAVSVSLKYSKIPIGYEYVVKPLVKIAAADILEDLRASIPKQVEGPKAKKAAA